MFLVFPGKCVGFFFFYVGIHFKNSLNQTAVTQGSSFSLPRRQLRWHQDPALLSHLSLVSQSDDCTSWWYEYGLFRRAFRNHNTWERVSPAGNHCRPSAAVKCVADNCADLTTLPSPPDSTNIWANAGCIYLLWKWLGKQNESEEFCHLPYWTEMDWAFLKLEPQSSGFAWSRLQLPRNPKSCVNCSTSCESCRHPSSI